MADAVIAQRSPLPVEVELGRKYVWCACGRSAIQPYCDGSHKGTGLVPVVFMAEKSETVWLCCCKRTHEPPFYDGSHESL